MDRPDLTDRKIWWGKLVKKLQKLEKLDRARRRSWVEKQKERKGELKIKGAESRSKPK